MDTLNTPDLDNICEDISIYTPYRNDPKLLEFILVQRQGLIQDAVERVRESALTGHKHHLLFVGPRGCGKTFLVTLLVSRISKDAGIADRLRIAWLNEDETCTTPLEFFLKIHSALKKRYPDEYRSEQLDPAYEMKPNDAFAFVSQTLLAALGSRTLLIVTENLDALFEGLGDSGQKQIRAFIQENQNLSIVATAQRLIEDLSSRVSPFFGFFQTEHLKPLKVEEATQLLQNIARCQGKNDVVEFLNASRGHSRVRALHHLSGGNHRIHIVLSQFITRDRLETLLEPFMDMVDKLTPYYQERIRWLPPLQRKIVEHLCACESTAPVKEIAKKLFATPQTISSQLQDLREKGCVEAHQRGRESLYEISEPLMRLCVEIKDTQAHQPLRLLVDFLRVWYDERELKTRLENIEPDSPAYAYLETALQKNLTQGNLQKQLLVKDLPSALLERTSEGSLKDLPDGVLLAMQSANDSDTARAFNSIDEVLMVDVHNILSKQWFIEGKWSEGFQALEAGLKCGAKAQYVYRAKATDLVGVIFSAGLSPDGRNEKVRNLLNLYNRYEALPVLGEAVVQHIGNVFRAGEPFPSSDNLEGWISAWEQAAERVPDFRLSIRLLRTGVQFVEAGGKDPGILLDLTSPERAILKQAFGLDEAASTPA